MKVREDMHNASSIAGMAFTNSSLGIVHSMAHKIGGEFGVTHGLANAILLPYIVEYNRKGNRKYDQMEAQLGISDLLQALKNLNQSVGIPLSFKEVSEVEISEERFNQVLDRMSKNAFADPCTLTNPRTTSPQDIKEIYKAAFLGTTAKNV
jgi:alcohol dehydrogenase class IV